MTRKDYKLIAKALGEAQLDWEDTLKVARSLGYYLQEDNICFDLSQFIKAVRETWEKAKVGKDDLR